MRSGDATYLNVRTNADPESDAAKTVLADVKTVSRPWPVEFGGQTAVNHDSLAALGAAMPYALVLIVLATFIVLFLFTGSVVLPLKALVLNTLSLSATFGAMVWIFQEGHFGSLFRDLTTTGYLVPTMPPLMFCLAFGLSMDYEVFLLSRIREEWLESGRTAADNTHAVALGLGRTGRIVTAAALLMAIVFAAMAGSQVSFMMLFGTGLTLGSRDGCDGGARDSRPGLHAAGRTVELVGATSARRAAQARSACTRLRPRRCSASRWACDQAAPGGARVG